MRRVLVAVDEQVTEPVLRRVAGFCRSRGASLRLASSVYEPSFAGERFHASAELDELRRELLKKRLARLEESAEALRAPDLDVSVAAAWSYPVYDAIWDQLAEYEADLLVRALAQGKALDATDWQIIRRSPVPLLTVRNASDAPWREVLVAVDPMHAHDKPAALDDALIAIARRFSARPHLLHCHLPPEYTPMLAPGAAGFHRRESSAAAHKDALQQFAERQSMPLSAITFESGDPREAIPEVARRRSADLVVMGVIARSRLKRLVIGSTADAVLQKLDCDVLTVKPVAAASGGN